MMQVKQNALQLTAVQLSGAISLPVLLAGYFVGMNFSASVGIPVIFLGNAILLLLALIYASIGYYYQTITVELVKKFFGERGIIVCGISLLVLMLGWSVIQYHFMGLAFQSMCGITHKGYIALMSLLTAMASYFAIRHGLNLFTWVNKCLMPCLLIVLYLTLKNAGITDINVKVDEISMALGLVMVMTTAGGMVFDCPTYYRHAVTMRTLQISLIMLFAIIVPAMEIVGFYLAKKSLLLADTTSLSSIFKQFDMAGLMFLCLSSFLHNCLNVYSATLVAIHFTKTSYKKTLAMICLICALLSLININELLLVYLQIINALSGIILLMIVTQQVFLGLNLNHIAENERRYHEYLLYLTIICTLLLQFVPGFKQYGLFITTSTVAMIIMFIYCQTRRLE